MSDQWWVRGESGTVSGPITAKDLSEGIRAGWLKPFVEVSQDQSAWRPAITVAELRDGTTATATPPASTEDSWWVRLAGDEVRGPWSAADIAESLRAGRLAAGVSVSRDQQTWSPATSVPELWSADAKPSPNPAWPPRVAPPAAAPNLAAAPSTSAEQPSAIVIFGGGFIILCLLFIVYAKATREPVSSSTLTAPPSATVSASEVATRSFMAGLGGVTMVTVPGLSLGTSCWSRLSGHGQDSAHEVWLCTRDRRDEHAAELERVRHTQAATPELQERLRELVALEERRAQTIDLIVNGFANGGDEMDADRRDRNWEDFIRESHRDSATRLRQLDGRLAEQSYPLSTWIGTVEPLLNRDLRCLEVPSGAPMNCAFYRVLRTLDGRETHVRVVLGGESRFPPWSTR